MLKLKINFFQSIIYCGQYVGRYQINNFAVLLSFEAIFFPKFLLIKKRK